MPINSLGEGALFHATCARLARPCIPKVHELLACLTAAARVDPLALRRSEPALVQRLDSLAVSVQEEVVTLRDYWEELLAEMTTQRALRPARARARVVRRSQCLHRGSRKLLAHT